MQEEMGRMFNEFKEMHTNAPKELIREYQTPEGVKGTRSRANSIWLYNDCWT